MEMKNSHNSVVNDILTNHLPNTLKSLNIQENQDIMSFKGYKWDTFHSKTVEFYEMTTEKTPEFKVVKLDDKTTIGWKLLKLFDNMALLENGKLHAMLKTNLSLQNLQTIKLNSQDWYFIKQPCLSLIEKLYLVKSITERDLNYITNFVVEDVMKDIQNWRKSEESGKNSDPIFLINEDLLCVDE